MRKDLIPRGRLNQMSIFDEFDNIFANVFQNVAPIHQQQGYPVCNIYVDTSDVLNFEFALAGFRKEEINIEVEDNILTISAEKQTEEDAENKYIVRRFTRKRFMKKYDLTDMYDPDTAQVSFVDGVLRLSFRKKEAQKSSVRKIEI